MGFLSDLVRGKKHYKFEVKDRSEQGNDIDCEVDAYNKDEAVRILSSGQYGDWGEQFISDHLAIWKDGEWKLINDLIKK